MAGKNYDLIVIGGGPGGQSAASTAASQGKRVALIERDRLGGTCHNYGCDPTKTLLNVAERCYEAHHARRYGLQIDAVELDWQAVRERVDEVLRGMRGGSHDDAWASMAEQGIDAYQEAARFVSPHEVAAGDTVLHGGQIIIATGTTAAVPPIDGLQDVGYITNVEAVDLPEVPRRMAIIGSGPIGAEFSQMFNRFGAEVTVFERDAQMLSTEDAELADALCKLLMEEGVQMETSIEMQRAEQGDDGKRLVYCNADGDEKTLTVDEILVAVGRKPQLDGLNLEAAGVESSDKGVVVDENLRTNVAHIWAVGDITGGYPFTHVAVEQGKHALQNAFADAPQPFDDRVVPWVTFTSPALAHVGKTEQQLRDVGVEYEVACLAMEENDRALTMGHTEGMVKILVGSDGQILGGHILAEDAGNMIGPIALAMHAKLPISVLAAAMLPYPTTVEAVRHTAQQLE